MARQPIMIARGLAAGVLLSILGFAYPSRVAAQDSVAARVAAHPHRGERPPEDAMAERGKNIPGYGGYFGDSRGDLIVLLTDTSAADVARSEFTPFLRTGPRRVLPPGWHRDPQSREDTTPPRIEIQKVNFTFDELRDWRDRVGGAAFSHWVTLGIDIKHNVVVAGIDRSYYEAELPELEHSLDEEAIPRAAVRFYPSSPMRPLVGTYTPQDSSARRD
ncbi:MAG TPA: hypothetical protein VK617_16465 [Gemmatimonadaceae bacterium]|nr:hypothetical protein [Gemmatimonadaceae bacterium]